MKASRLFLFFEESGKLTRFSFLFFREIFIRRPEPAEFFRQSFRLGYKSLPLILLTNFIIGIVLTMQMRPYMVGFGVVSELPAIVGIAVVREVGPVLTALIFAGKIGSSIGAELGSMRVTEQIDAMEVSGTNAYNYLVVTRVLATTLCMPLLSILGDFMAFAGSYFAINSHGHTGVQLYWNEVILNLSYSDILPAFIKTFIFGFTVGIVGCYAGYNSSYNTESVGRSANMAVVVSSVLIFVTDLLVVQLTDFLGFS